MHTFAKDNVRQPNALEYVKENGEFFTLTINANAIPNFSNLEIEVSDSRHPVYSFDSDNTKLTDKDRNQK